MCQALQFGAVTKPAFPKFLHSGTQAVSPSQLIDCLTRKPDPRSTRLDCSCLSHTPAAAGVECCGEEQQWLVLVDLTRAGQQVHIGKCQSLGTAPVHQNWLIKGCFRELQGYYEETGKTKGVPDGDV